MASDNQVNDRPAKGSKRPGQSTWRDSDNPSETLWVSLGWIVIPLLASAAIAFALSGAS